MDELSGFEFQGGPGEVNNNKFFDFIPNSKRVAAAALHLIRDNEYPYALLNARESKISIYLLPLSLLSTVAMNRAYRIDADGPSVWFHDIDVVR